MQSNPLLQRVSDIIQNAVPVIRIVLLAYSNNQKRSFNIFEHPVLELDDPAELHLFVLADVPKLDRPVATESLELKCRSTIAVQITLMNKEEFAALMLQGNRLAITVMQSSMVLFDNGNTEETLTVGQDNTNHTSEVLRWYRRGIGLLDFAKSQFRLGEFCTAAFSVQQAAEHFLCMLSQISIGYRISTHNIEKYLRIIQFYVPDILDVFPRETQEERKLLQLLKNSYVRFLFKSEFTVADEDAEYFMEEGYKLQRVAEALFYTQTPIYKYSKTLVP